MSSTFWLRIFRNFLEPKRFAILEACLIGLIAALAAVLLKQGVGWIGAWRVHTAHILPAWLVLPGIGLVGGLLSGWLVERVAPEASGSGIPQVKAVLAKVPMALDIRVALIKLSAGILALGSGLPLGREGPTVQVGAALAAQLSRIFPTSPDYRRQLIAAGAGAGLAAAFNTPIAGVLFVVEELLQDVSGFTLGTAILASFIGAVVSRWLGGHSLDLELSALHTSFSPQEIPFYIALGVLAGLLGSLFNQGILASLTLNRRFLPFGLPWRVGLAGLVCGIAVALLPMSFRDSAGLRELLTAGVPGNWQLAATAFVAQFILTIVAYGSGAAGGLFAPVLILGAALGLLVGICENSLLHAGAPVTYALAGMGTFFGAVVRVPITGIVIVFEMTTDFNLVLPLMIGSAVAYLVAEQTVPGSLYDRLLEWNGIHLQEDPAAGGLLAQLKATDVMQRRVETLSGQMSLDEAVQAFSQSQHRNFPVIEKGKLAGIITQKDLADLTKERLGGEKTVSELMTPEPLTVRPTDTLAHVLHVLNRYNLSCLPVTENRKLVGIITRSDIIRAEADHFNGKMATVGPKPNPSYVVYQTRAPATGKGRLLVPLSHPNTAATLVQMAAAIAKERDYELELLQVMIVPRNQPPSETAVRITTSRRLLSQAQRLGQAWQIPVHTQIRVAHEVSSPILETVKERHIDLILMGWKGTTLTPGRVFSQVVDTVIRQAPCEVVLAKFNGKKVLNRWLVPMAGGPNSSQAVRLLPALVSLSQKPEIKLCQVFGFSESVPDITVLEQSVHFLKPRVSGKVSLVPLYGNSVCEAVITLAQQDESDAIILGASREGLLQQAINGNIPETISRNSDCTVILVRSA